MTGGILACLAGSGVNWIAITTDGQVAVSGNGVNYVLAAAAPGALSALGDIKYYTPSSEWLISNLTRLTRISRNGSTLINSNFPAGANCRTVACDPAIDRIVVAGADLIGGTLSVYYDDLLSGSWTEVDTGLSTSELNDIDFNGTNFVAVSGSSAEIGYSPDASTAWTNSFTGGGSPQGGCTIASGNGHVIVIVNNTQYAYSSNNGASFALRSLPAGGLTIATFDERTNNFWLFGVGGFAYYTTAPGVAVWTISAAMDAYDNLNAAACYNGRVSVVGEEGGAPMIQSTDDAGATWTTLTLPFVGASPVRMIGGVSL
jgi:hypothetical protein